MQAGSIFSYKNLGPEEIERLELRRALLRTPEEQLRFLTELIELSALFSTSADGQTSSPAMTPLYEAVIAFFQQLHKHSVEYLLVGGFTVNAWGFARNTGDLDLWVHDTPENRKALGTACAGVGGGELLEKMNWGPGWTGFYLPNGFKVEIMGYLAGFTKNDFAACYARSEKINIRNIEIPVLGLDDLIQEKQALKRQRDMEDITILLDISKSKGVWGRFAAPKPPCFQKCPVVWDITQLLRIRKERNEDKL